MNKNPEVSRLIHSLTQLVGNKRYLRDIESLLNRLDLTPAEKQSLRYLSQDIQFVKVHHNNEKKNMVKFY